MASILRIEDTWSDTGYRWHTAEIFPPIIRCMYCQSEHVPAICREEAWFREEFYHWNRENIGDRCFNELLELRIGIVCWPARENSLDLLFVVDSRFRLVGCGIPNEVAYTFAQDISILFNIRNRILIISKRHINPQTENIAMNIHKISSEFRARKLSSLHRPTTRFPM